MQETKRFNYEIYAVLVLGVVFIATVIVAFLYKGEVLDLTIPEPVSYVDDSETYIEATEANTIKLKSRYYSLENDWTQVDASRGASYENIECIDTSKNCLIYKINRGDITFYVSDSPVRAINNSEEGVNAESTYNIDVQTKEGPKLFQYTSVNVYVPNEELALNADSAGVEIVKYTQQVYGCINKNLCITSGNIPLDQEENKIYLDNFYNLVLSIKVVE